MNKCPLFDVCGARVIREKGIDWFGIVWSDWGRNLCSGGDGNLFPEDCSLCPHFQIRKNEPYISQD